MTPQQIRTDYLDGTCRDASWRVISWRNGLGVTLAAESGAFSLYRSMTPKEARQLAALLELNADVSEQADQRAKAAA